MRHRYLVTYFHKVTRKQGEKKLYANSPKDAMNMVEDLSGGFKESLKAKKIGN